MSAGTLIAPRANGSSSGDTPAVIRPQSIGIAAEQQRVQAEIQSRLMVAKSCRRDEVDAVDRIKNSCQRIGLADKAEYVYSRGGTDITGPTIDLLTVIANHWGNIDYGFRELSQANQESVVECFAWDLETNAKRTAVVTVPHKRFTRAGTTTLTDPRDIYEAVANYAQRRVRACLEAIIPPDVVEDAIAECRATLQAKAEVTPDSIAKTVAAFAKLGVTKEQIEVKLGRRMDAMQPAQLVNLRRIYKSICDGMSKADDWFEVKQEAAPAASAADAAKDALRKKAAPKPAAAVEDEIDRPQTTDEPEPSLLDRARETFAGLSDATAVDYELDQMLTLATDETTRTAMQGLAGARKKALAKK